MDQTPYLSYFLQSDNNLPPVAKTTEECHVGPSLEECADGAPSWGQHVISRSSPTASTLHNDESGGRKRQQPSDSDCKKGACKTVGEMATNNDPTTIINNNETSLTFSKGVGTFLSSGCCVIPNVLPTEFVSSCKQKATDDLKFLNSELDNRKKEAIKSNSPHLLSAVQRGDFRELVKRDGGRCDVRFQLDRFPFTCSGLIYNSVVFPMVRELLGGGEVSLLYMGIMWALSPSSESKEEGCGRKPQKWHGDGGHLYHHSHLPPHCINVFYPLVDITPEVGGTEFVPGSHRLGQFDKLCRNEHGFGLCCKAGSAVLFDYRVKHRGGANLSAIDRPVLYLAYAKSFFRDAGNLRSGNSLVSSISSPAWVSRILDGEAMRMGCGFNDKASSKNFSTSGKAGQNDNQAMGSGERWVLFKMNVELDSGNPQTITVHNGDVASEVSLQFCKSQNLSDDFVPLLTNAIQQQIDGYMASRLES